MSYSEKLVCWISSSAEVCDGWSLSGHKSGQIVSEMAYHVTNL